MSLAPVAGSVKEPCRVGTGSVRFLSQALASPKLERLTSRMRGRLKRRTLNELADRDRHSNRNDLWHISAGIPWLCSLDGPPPIDRSPLVKNQPRPTKP